MQAGEMQAGEMQTGERQTGERQISAVGMAFVYMKKIRKSN